MRILARKYKLLGLFSYQNWEALPRKFVGEANIQLNGELYNHIHPQLCSVCGGKKLDKALYSMVDSSWPASDADYIWLPIRI